MTETITIEVNANVKDAQKGMSDLRSDLKKTQKESQKTKSSFEGIGKSLGALSPQLGRITQGISKLAESIKRLGSQTGSANGTTGQTASGLGRLGSSGALKKGIGIAGIAIAGTSLLSSILGKDNNKLAPFDKLNAVGQETILDFLRGKLPRMGDDLKSIAESAAATATATTGLLELYRLLNGIGNPKPNPDPTVNGGGAVIVPGIPGDKESREREEQSDKNKRFWERFRDDGELSMESFKNGILDLMSSATATWSNLKDQLTRTIEDIKDAIPGTPVTPDNEKSSSSEKKGLWKTITEGIADWNNNDNLLNKAGYEATGFTSRDLLNPVSFGKALIDKATGSYEKTEWTAEDVGDMIITAATAGIGAGIGGAVSKGASALGKVGSKAGNIIKDVPSLFGFAEGGLFEPNRPQLAILGDNRTEPEVAAPKSLIVEAVKEAVASMSSGGGIGSMNERSREPIPITLELDGRVLARLLYDPLNNETIRRNGVGSV